MPAATLCKTPVTITWENTGMAADKSRKKKDVIDEARKKVEKFILRQWWISVISRARSQSLNIKSTKQSSASQMTAAKVMDIISRLPGCSGQAADAVSAYTQVKKENASSSLKFPKSECPDIWIRLTKHKWPISWSCMEDPVVPLERNLHGHPLAGLLCKWQIENVP